MTTTTNIAELQDQLAPLAEHLAEVQRAVAGLKREEAQIRAAIRALTDTAGPGTYGAGNHAITISLNRRLDLDAVAAAYPPAQYPNLYTLKPDTALVRANLTPAQVDDLMVEAGEPRITVRDAK